MSLLLLYVAGRTLTHLEGKGKGGCVSASQFAQALGLASYELLTALGILHDPFECPLV